MHNNPLDIDLCKFCGSCFPDKEAEIGYIEFLESNKNEEEYVSC
jgi:hypothetical protein